ncbi:MAG: hypothetical protein ICV69_00985 [Thermoleophilaceae bacterium]|nr:hypothetical protein [Thermoleophilaceae bacterium]
MASLKSRSYYSTQAPRIEALELDGGRLRVKTSPAHAIAVGGARNRWLDATTVLDESGPRRRGVAARSRRPGVTPEELLTVRPAVVSR